MQSGFQVAVSKQDILPRFFAVTSCGEMKRQIDKTMLSSASVYRRFWNLCEKTYVHAVKKGEICMCVLNRLQYQTDPSRKKALRNSKSLKEAFFSLALGMLVELETENCLGLEIFPLCNVDGLFVWTLRWLTSLCRAEDLKLPDDGMSGEDCLSKGFSPIFPCFIGLSPHVG